jgi:hypothetical protein
MSVATCLLLIIYGHNLPNKDTEFYIDTGKNSAKYELFFFYLHYTKLSDRNI